MPEVSFLLPVYNGERYLAETLRSLLAQDHQDFDIVIIDDGSTDRTAEIVEAAASNRIVYHHKPNGGLVDALNFGLERLDCQYVARIDADDICFPNRLTQQIDFVGFTGADAVSSRSLHIDEVGNILGVSGSYDVFSADPAWLPAKEPYLPHPFMFARLSVLRDVGGYRQAHLAEDADLSWRLSERVPIAVQGEVLGKYRLHTDSVSTRSVQSGRVQSLFSQIAALNAARRRAGAREVPYEITMPEALDAASSWDGLLGLVGDLVSQAEMIQLRAASVLKLLDLARWRNYAAEPEDLAFAVRALRRAEAHAENRIEAKRLIRDSLDSMGSADSRLKVGDLLWRLWHRV